MSDRNVPEIWEDLARERAQLKDYWQKETAARTLRTEQEEIVKQLERELNVAINRADAT